MIRTDLFDQAGLEVNLTTKAILYLYVGDKVKELRTHGINGMIELVGLVKFDR